MSEQRRYTTALVLVAALLLLIEKGGLLSFCFFAAALSILSLIEIKGLFRVMDFDMPLFLLVLSGAAICYSFSSGNEKYLPIVYFMSLFSVAVWNIIFFSTPQKALYSIVFFMFSLFYITLPAGSLVAIRKMDGGLSYIYILLMATWASDTGAYLTGKKWGKRKLAPAISPNKTVEGLAGGIFLSCAAFMIWRGIGIIGTGEALFLGTLLSLAATAGDLVESIIKRAAGVKDSGTMIPGHGGILDRIDALLFTAPVWYIYIIITN